MRCAKDLETEGSTSRTCAEAAREKARKQTLPQSPRQQPSPADSLTQAHQAPSWTLASRTVRECIYQPNKFVIIRVLFQTSKCVAICYTAKYLWLNLKGSPRCRLESALLVNPTLGGIWGGAGIRAEEGCWVRGWGAGLPYRWVWGDRNRTSQSWGQEDQSHSVEADGPVLGAVRCVSLVIPAPPHGNAHTGVWTYTSKRVLAV